MRQSIHDRPTSQLKGETTEHSFHPRWQKVVKMFKQMHWQQNESIKDNSAWGLVIRVLKYALTLTLHGVTSKTTNPITCGDKETHKTNLCVCVLLYLYLFSIYIYILQSLQFRFSGWFPTLLGGPISSTSLGTASPCGSHSAGQMLQLTTVSWVQDGKAYFGNFMWILRLKSHIKIPLWFKVAPWFPW